MLPHGALLLSPPIFALTIRSTSWMPAVFSTGDGFSSIQTMHVYSYFAFFNMSTTSSTFYIRVDATDVDPQQFNLRVDYLAMVSWTAFYSILNVLHQHTHALTVFCLL